MLTAFDSVDGVDNVDVIDLELLNFGNSLRRYLVLEKKLSIPVSPPELLGGH